MIPASEFAAHISAFATILLAPSQKHHMHPFYYT